MRSFSRVFSRIFYGPIRGEQRKTTSPLSLGKFDEKIRRCFRPLCARSAREEFSLVSSTVTSEIVNLGKNMKKSLKF